MTAGAARWALHPLSTILLKSSTSDPSQQLSVVAAAAAAAMITTDVSMGQASDNPGSRLLSALFVTVHGHALNV